MTKLPLLTAHEINKIALRAEDTIKNTTSRSSHLMCVENAIREAVQLMIDKLDIQIVSPFQIDLSKH
ncbi:hypothetical protein QGX12_gp004 [Pseudomonas phage Kremar]|uniref:Uncharacterized protein n=1 Tax=Pseudomonas phage Kremar TaxID=2928831 RepID=A0AAE9KGD0_9CAUD|nr:hypothetical protein QGX12_gp004 [Pseudomonas phage Kremar]UOL48427.1 hypothetical protein [Pseudomonas phage Kremar]